MIRCIASHKMSRVLLEVAALALRVLELRVVESSLVLPILSAICVYVGVIGLGGSSVDRAGNLALYSIEVICISSELVILFTQGLGLLSIEIRSVLLNGVRHLATRHVLVVELGSVGHGVSSLGWALLAVGTEELLGVCCVD